MPTSERENLITDFYFPIDDVKRKLLHSVAFAFIGEKLLIFVQGICDKQSAPLMTGCYVVTFVGFVSFDKKYSSFGL